MKKLALALCSTLVLLGACASPVTAPQHELRVSNDQTPDTVSVAAGGHGMGSGN
jgi:hypothetical protein